MNISPITHDQKILFAKNLALMLKSGVSISEALEMLAEQSSGKFKKTITDICKSVSSGSSLSEALGRYPRVFSVYFVNCAKSGEQSGRLEENLADIAQKLKKDKETTAKIKSAMAYPLIVVIGGLGLAFLIAYIVLPKIVPLFIGLKVKLPLSTRILIWVSGVLEKNELAFLVICAVVPVLGVFIWNWKPLRPARDMFLLRLPVFGKLVRCANLASFARTTGALLRSGLSIDEALKVSREVSANYYYKKSIGQIFEKASQGGRLADNLGFFPGLYPSLIRDLVMVGERSGSLEEVLLFVADHYEDELDCAIRSLTAAIEPILLLLVGGMVGWLAISIIGPIYQITGNIQR